MDCTKENEYEGKNLRPPHHALSAYVYNCSNYIMR